MAGLLMEKLFAPKNPIEASLGLEAGPKSHHKRPPQEKKAAEIVHVRICTKVIIKYYVRELAENSHDDDDGWPLDVCRFWPV